MAEAHSLAVSGETIDYGPCAVTDQNYPQAVFSSIFQFDSYAYDKQPEIAIWNLAQFAWCLLPLMGKTQAAVEMATTSVKRFLDTYAS